MTEKAIFLEALDAPPADRAAFLDRACGGDAALRRGVDALLAAHERSGLFLDAAADATTDPDRPPAGEGVAAVLALLAPPAGPGSLGRLGHYEVREVLGAGGFGVVLRAFDGRLHRDVAIKVLAPHLAATSPPRKRFLREARAAAAVRHENVVAVHAVEEHPVPHLVMEYVPGGTLQGVIDRAGPLDPADAVRVGREVAAGLAAAHALGLVHRDVKPANILLDGGPARRAKLTDFGLARAADDASLTRSGMIVGTPLYMAPEQAAGRPLDPRADLFSLGGVLYVMCTGRPPFRAPTALAVLKRVVEDDPRPVRELAPETPAWLCDLIARLHAKDPAARPASAAEVADLLARGAAAPAPAAPAPDPPTGDGPTRTVAPAPAPVFAARRPRRRAAAAALLAVALLAGLGLAEAAGVTRIKGTVVRFFSPEGTLVVEVDDPGVSVAVDGADVVVGGAGAKEIRLKPGPYTLRATRDGRLVREELVTVTRDGRQVVRVSREPAPQPPPAAPGPSPAAAWERATAALPVRDQVAAVAAKLKELNPGFEGELQPVFEFSEVVRLNLPLARVADLSPLRGFPRLRELHRPDGGEPSPLADLSPLAGLPLTELGVRNTRVADLSPIKGWKLTHLDVGGCPVADLAPLEGMPLTRLSCAVTRVTDLSPLKGLPLESFDCSVTRVTDLSPLRGMPLTSLRCGDTRVADLSPLAGSGLTLLACNNCPVSDLSPLKGLPLEELELYNCPLSDLAPLAGSPLKRLLLGGNRVTDLTPLKGMPLRFLGCASCPVSDLSPLKGLPLTAIDIWKCPVSDLSPLAGMRLDSVICSGTKVTDLTPLKGMPLRHLDCGFEPTRDAAVLRAIPTLEVINSKPAADFWKAVDGAKK